MPVTADDFIYAWQSQRGDGVDVDGQPDQVGVDAGLPGRRLGDRPAMDGKTVTVVFSTPFTDWRVMFNHMVPAHIASRVGWNHGFDTFDPVRRPLGGPAGAEVGLIDGHGGPGPKSQVVGSPGGARPGDGQVGAPTRRLDPGTGRRQSDGRPADRRSTSARSNACPSLPNTQSEVKPSLDLLELEFNMTSPVTSGPPPARRSPTPSTGPRC